MSPASCQVVGIDDCWVQRGRHDAGKSGTNDAGSAGLAIPVLLIREWVSTDLVTLHNYSDKFDEVGDAFATKQFCLRWRKKNHFSGGETGVELVTESAISVNSVVQAH